MLIDTHCHLNDPALENLLPELLARAQAAGVVSLVVPAYDLASFQRTAALAASFPNLIYPAYGIHPWYLDHIIDHDEIFKFLQKATPVAVGEIGLDLAPGCRPEELQMEALAHQLDFARDLDLPIILHCRRAHEPLLQIVRTYQGSLRGVLHSFSGSKELMFRFLDLGFYISFSGSVTRKTARKYHCNAQMVPADRFLLETDTPSIATETTVASEVEPFHVVEVAQKIAQLRDLSFETVCRQSTENARRLFKLPAKTTHAHP